MMSRLWLIVDIADALKSDASNLRKGNDKDFEAAQNTLRLLPSFLIRPVLWLTGWLTSSLGIDMSFLGLKKISFWRLHDHIRRDVWA